MCFNTVFIIYLLFEAIHIIIINKNNKIILFKFNNNINNINKIIIIIIIIKII